MNDPSPAFKAAVNAAMAAIYDVPDDAIRYMLDGWGNPDEAVPVFVEAEPSPEQMSAAGCPNCTYLGLWAESWPGLPRFPHGVIWLFEKGIKNLPPDLPFLKNERPIINQLIAHLRQTAGPHTANVFQVLVHEYQHALQRDHVLDAMEKNKHLHPHGMRAAAMTTAGCGCLGSR